MDGGGADGGIVGKEKDMMPDRQTDGRTNKEMH